MNKNEHWCHNVAPPSPGVYERLLDGVLGIVDEHHFSLWDGKAWLRLAATPALAALQTDRSLFNSRPWTWRVVAEEAATPSTSPMES
jgi:hypothetical protein